ncbi:MAG: choice-of-anchor D domain-containing protein [Verrucomicrobiae bacterium]|nr:choice-of-anchor D domain-containing protein [Verrucomicrobiae bacterium]
MKGPHIITLIAGLASCLAVPVSAQTNFTDADGTDSLITNAGNWDNGLPTGGTSGTLAVNAGYSTALPLVGYDITHTAGTLSRASGLDGLPIGTGTTYRMNGVGAGFSSTRGIIVDGAAFILDDGDANVAASSSKDSTVNGGGSITINGGAFSNGRHLYLQNGDITVNGGTVTVPVDVGARNFHTGGNLALNGGTTTATYLTFGTGGFDLNFGGTTAGTFTIENFGGSRANVNHIDIDFDPGTLMAMQLTAPVEQGVSGGDGDLGWTDAGDAATGLEWAQALWETGRLSYNNHTVSGVDILGEGGTTVLTWAQAQVDLGDGSLFVYNSSTDTLSLGSSGGGAPEIVVEQPAAADIANGGSKDFGTVSTGSDASLTFTVRNTGTAALDLTGSPLVAVSGTNAADFTVTADPSTPVSSGGGTTTFTVRFAPGDAGVRNALLTIANNDSDENPFTINVSGTGTAETPYETWAGGAAFDADANDDGVKNGLAFLLGADSPTSAVTLPTATHTSGNLILSFSMRNSANRGTATLIVQHSSDLGIGDPWSAGATVPTDGDGVTFTVTPGSPLDSVTAEISSSEAASDKLFGRLKAVSEP